MANSLAFAGTAPNLFGQSHRGHRRCLPQFCWGSWCLSQTSRFFCWYRSLAELGKSKVINTFFGDTVEGRNPKQPPWMLKNPENNVINYLSTDAGFQPSTTVSILLWLGFRILNYAVASSSAYGKIIAWYFFRWNKKGQLGFGFVRAAIQMSMEFWFKDCLMLEKDPKSRILTNINIYHIQCKASDPREFKMAMEHAYRFYQGTCI